MSGILWEKGYTDMLLKTSIVCLLFSVYMIGFYYRKPHIPIKSTRVFRVLTGVALLNALFDCITVYTVNHRDTVPDTVNLVALIMLGLILSNENTEKYVDEKTTLFNQYSFETVLGENDFEKQKMIIAVLCFYKTENNFDWEQDVLILQDIHKAVKAYRLEGYRIGENGVAFISSSAEKAHTVLEKVKSAVEGKYGGDCISIDTKVLSNAETATKYNCMQSIVAFCTETGSQFAYIDYMTHIYNRNALERDLGKLAENSSGYYMIADLNDLKKVNDTIGHSAGDKLLQGFAGLLSGTVGENGRAYRRGGDEFAVLYDGDAEQFIRELEEHCRIYNQSSNVPISYAIGCCELRNEDFLNVADNRMYAHKRTMKQMKKDAFYG